MTNLNLGVVGNCSIAMLVDNAARIVWGGFPRLDGEPIFCALLGGADPYRTDNPSGGGYFAVELANQTRSEPCYVPNSAILCTRLYGDDGSAVDRAGLRQMPMSEVMIREVKVVTTGYAPEFGQTMGLVYNAVTPSGANTMKGQASYRFQREPLVALPFFSTTTVKPPTDVNIFTIDNGGPIVKDRTFYFGGFESTKRDLSGARVITITPANAASSCALMRWKALQK